MFGIILAIIVVIAGIVATIVSNKIKMENYNDKLEDWRDAKQVAQCRFPNSPFDRPEPVKPQKIRFPIYIALALAFVILIASCVAIVPTGYTGILTTFGRVEERTIPAGINLIAPWQNVIKMDNRTQKVQIATSAFSSDIQQVDVQLSVNYCIDQETAQILYRTVGIEYYNNIMFPRIQENLKAVFSQYTAESLIAKRDSLDIHSVSIAEANYIDMQGYGITIVSIAIEDIDFTDAFTAAVEAKQVAAQNKLTAETEQAQKTMEQQAAAERAIIAA